MTEPQKTRFVRVLKTEFNGATSSAREGWGHLRVLKVNFLKCDLHLWVILLSVTVEWSRKKHV